MTKIARHSNKIVIGIPVKGRIRQHVLEFLADKQYYIPEDLGRKLTTHLVGMDCYQIVFVHAKDIPILVQNSLIDVGFTGLDLITETNVNVRPVIKISKKSVKMVIAVPHESPYTHPAHLMNLSVATPFPNIARRYFDAFQIPVTISSIQGSSEIMPYLGVTAAIMDVVETGETLKNNNLRIIEENVFESDTVCIVNKPEFAVNHSLIHEFLRSIY